MKKALLIVDYQYDFVNPLGSLYVKGAEKLSNYITELLTKFKEENHMVFASQDWHPNNHYSFKQWGVHCLQNEQGSQLCLPVDQVDEIIIKGTDPEIESYSAFYDEKGNSNHLHEKLEQLGIKELTIVGVATDICVANTVADAIKLGYKTILDLEGCAGFTDKIPF
ncbi:isochorismatase family protein [Spiroplasma alleghenense]|nr:isochorismatase family protein [Spiroplasma alleghenense]